VNIDILYESYDLLVLSKPAGIAVECPREHGTPLVDIVARLKPGYNNCHRIDKGTSGLVLFATKEWQKWIMSNWHDITTKVYLAIIINPVNYPNWVDGKAICDLPVEVDKGVYKSATTSFEILHVSNGLALVMCRLEKNGRRHQIRQHLQFLGSPILGDLFYGGLPVHNGRPLLHAWKLFLTLKERELVFQASIPDDFKRIFKIDPKIWERLDEGATVPIGSF